MAGTTGPLLSLRARGQIAKTLVYASWRGIPYARTYVIPQNPRTSGQLLTRQAFEALNVLYQYGTPSLFSLYDTLTTGRPLTNRNRWIQVNLSSIRSASDLTDLRVSPGQSPIPAPTTPIITGGLGTISSSADDGPFITGWDPVQLVLFAMTDLDPSNPGPYPVVTAQANDVATPFAPTIAPIAPGTYHVALAWEYVQTGPPLARRWGPSFDDTVTVT